MAEDPKPKPWSPSDRAELDAFLSERRFKEQHDAYHERLAEKRKRKIESIRGWASLLITIAAAVSFVWDRLVAIWTLFITGVS